MTSGNERFVVIGGGQAGGRAVEAMRRGGHEGPVALVSEEPHLPYERPPLSKNVLTGDDPAHVVHLHDDTHYGEWNVDMRLDVRATSIDRDGKVVHLDDGESLPYDKLLIATGAAPIELPVPGAHLDGIHYLRTLQDSLDLQRRLSTGTRLVMVGGGYIGLEVAAAARKRGCEVIVVEMQDRAMARVVGSEVADAFRRYHEDEGVRFRFGVGVTGFAGSDHVDAVLCSDGSAIPADVVVVGIGVRPITDLAVKAGLEVADGLLVDAHGRTSDPAIYAAGDVTRHPNPILGRDIRLESWQNAQNQAIRVARNMAGEDQPYEELPWFWSDQHDINLQIVGLPETWDRVVVRGDIEERKWTALYLHGDRLVAANAINNAREIAPCRKLIANGIAVDAAKLADPETVLKRLLR